jgi:hypothetical protein
MVERTKENTKSVDIIFRTSMLTMSYLNEYFAKNNKDLSLADFMIIQQRSFAEATALCNEDGV